MFVQKENYKVEDLCLIVDLLRSENGCPWDREQTHESIRNNFIEEVYEVCEAIDADNYDMLVEELGDVLLQIVFHSNIGSFRLDEVANGICHKLIHRHPHIFQQVKVSNSDDVLRNWEDIKKVEKGHETFTQTMRAVPKVFPGLMRSAKVQKRAAKTGFDYLDVNMALDHLESEIKELRQAILNNDIQNINEEIGDVLFSGVNVSRFVGVDAEEAISRSCEKFINRFEVVERLSIENNIDMRTQDIEMLNELWSKAKVKNTTGGNKND